MKKLLSLTLAGLFMAGSAFAMPQAADQLTTDLLTGNAEFEALLKDNSGSSLFDQKFNEVTVKKVPAHTPELVELCGNGSMSKSGTVLKVLLTKNGTTQEGDKTTQTKEFYFYTAHSSAGFKLCRE